MCFLLHIHNNRFLGVERELIDMKTEIVKLNESLIKIPIPESYRDCMSLIRSDEYRLSGKNESSLKLIFKNFHPFKNSVLFWLRLSQYREGWLFWFCRIMHLYASKRYHVQISPLSKIGYGFYIGHGISMIVNSGTTIGNNVNLSQFLNIVTNHETPAFIVDNVYIGPMVCIVEDVKIGSNSTIGAGAVVTKDVPENATVVGVPAKVLNYNDPGRYIINRFEVE